MWEVADYIFEGGMRHFLRRPKESGVGFHFFPDTRSVSHTTDFCESLDHALLMCDVLNIRDYGHVGETL
jgi:hypothetical protein